MTNPTERGRDGVAETGRELGSPPSRRSVLLAGAAVAGATAGCLGTDDVDAGDASSRDDEEADTIDAGDGTSVAVEPVAEGLDQPWGIAPLPDTDELLVTELPGSLILVDTATAETHHIDGVPAVHAAGQGGLLDVAVHPEYPDESWVYLTYAAGSSDGESTTAVGRGRLDRDARSLEVFERLYTAQPSVDSSVHYGSRCLFGPDDWLYVTVGDRGFKNFGPEHPSQDPSNDIGTTLRFEPDGSIPDENPFVADPDGRDAVFTYGHRNAQGATVHPETGELWLSEHGEQDGDELNVLEASGNYGWPVATYGCTYDTGGPVGDQPDERDDTVDPVYHWPCNSGGFPPAGATFYDGDGIPEWRGDLFVGNLAGQYLGRFAVDGHDVEELDPLLDGRGWRIRDVCAHGPTDGLFVIVDDSDAPLLSLTPV